MSKPSRKKKPGAAPARPVALDSKALRFVLNGDHPSGVERIDWRGTGAEAKEVSYPLDGKLRKQPIDSIRALAIGMLCLAHCRNKRGHELSELGTVTVEKKQGGWEIRKLKPKDKGSNWLQTLANGYEPRGAKDDEKNPTSPIGKLLKALPGLLNEQTRQWIASPADDSGLPSFWCHDYEPSDSSDYGGPKLLFRQVIQGKESGDLPDTTDWLALAREIEKARPAWKPLLQPPRRPELDPAPLKRYFQHLVSECRHLPLIAIDEKATNPDECAKLDLAHIYVELGTQLREQREDHDETIEAKTRAGLRGAEGNTLSALRAVAQLDRLALTGSPGSGKTTFTRHFSLCFAQRALQPRATPPTGLKDWPDDAPRFLVPVTIELRRFARSLPKELPREKQPGPRELWDFFTQTVLDGSKSRSGHRLSDLAGLLETAVAEGHAVVFFEGLDEVPTGEQRDYVRRAVMAFAAADHFKASRVVLTCRTRAYAQPHFALKSFTEAPLAGFTEPQIDAFIEAWYREIAPLNKLDPEEAARRAGDLRQRVRLPSLWELAPTPLLLTVMTHVHASKNELPETRAKVYARMVDILLSRWDSLAKSEFAPMKDLLAEVNRDSEALRRALSKLAFKLRGLRRHKSRDAEDYGDIPRHELREALADVPKPRDYNWADRAIDTIEQRSGLIAPDGVAPEGETASVFTSPHPSFQEYLAGAHLAGGSQTDLVVDSLNLAKDVSGYWDETILWAVGYTAHVNEMERNWRDIRLLADKLCQDAPPGSPLRAHHVGLAGEILLETGRGKLEQILEGLDCLGRVKAELEKCLIDAQIPPKARANCGIVLGKLGDPRAGVRLKDGLPDIDCADFWVNLPKGEFLRGEDNESAKIEKPFRLSRYPITWQQYQAFVDDKGYEQKDLWNGKWKHGQDAPGMLDWWKRNKDKGPENYDAVFQTPNHPRVGVCWYEAVAFCRWLTERQSQISNSKSEIPKIRLPHENEWEWAARWSRDGGPDYRREYPWGNERSDAELSARCNWHKTGLGHTSAVGLFPDGKADCGALDLSGNVWEWCNNWYDEKSKTSRVLRGGSWGLVRPDVLRAAFRNRVRPGLRAHYFGFRLVCVEDVSP